MTTGMIDDPIVWPRIISVTPGWGGVAGAAIALSALLGTSTAGPPTRVPQASIVAARTEPGFIVASADAVTRSAVFPVKSTADQVQFVHERSGLTWEQVARLMGVSRRSVHSWASGGRLSSANAERVAEVAGLLKTRTGFSSDSNRDWLLAGTPVQPSIFDSLRSSWRRGAIVDEALTLQEHMGLL